MKLLAISSAAVILFSNICCSTPEKNAQLGALADLAITYAERKGQISPQDAQAIRDAKVIVLPPETTLPAVEVSGK